MDHLEDTQGRVKLWKLFWGMMYISAFTFGGGFVIVSVMKKKFVDQLQWLEEQEMLDLTALGQSSPGPIAVNAAILLGAHLDGIRGMLVAVTGTIIPPVAILTVISCFYIAFITNPYVSLLLRGMQAGVAAILLDVIYGLVCNVVHQKSLLYLSIMIAAFVTGTFFHVNVIWIILGIAMLGVWMAHGRRGGMEK